MYVHGRHSVHSLLYAHVSPGCISPVATPGGIQTAGIHPLACNLLYPFIPWLYQPCVYKCWPVKSSQSACILLYPCIPCLSQFHEYTYWPLDSRHSACNLLNLCISRLYQSHGYTCWPLDCRHSVLTQGSTHKQQKHKDLTEKGGLLPSKSLWGPMQTPVPTSPRGCRQGTWRGPLHRNGWVQVLLALMYSV